VTFHVSTYLKSASGVNTAMWNMTPCNLVYSYGRFGRTWFLQLQGVLRNDLRFYRKR